MSPESLNLQDGRFQKEQSRNPSEGRKLLHRGWLTFAGMELIRQSGEQRKQ